MDEILRVNILYSADLRKDKKTLQQSTLFQSTGTEIGAHTMYSGTPLYRHPYCNTDTVLFVPTESLMSTKFTTKQENINI